MTTQTAYDALEKKMRAAPAKFLVTGAAGFIGSHLVERLIRLGQQVVGLDNFETGHRHNVDAVAGDGYTFVEGDIRDATVCDKVMEGTDFVLHQAALGSVPRSIEQPVRTHAANVDGFLNVLKAARDARVKGFVYASSSSVYGDHEALPKVEAQVGTVLSPYALSKKINEQYAGVFSRCYNFPATGLRYFNVFGPRQDPNGAYAAVIPKWLATMRSGAACQINGDGETSRDFCFVENAVQANLLAASAPPNGARVLNVAVGERATLNALHQALAHELAERGLTVAAAHYGPFRDGDVRHSLANVDLANSEIGYVPVVKLKAGLKVTVDAFWEGT